MKPASWSETKHRSETDGAAFESCDQDAPNPCFNFKIKVRSKVKMMGVTFWVLGSVRRDTNSSNYPKLLCKCLRRLLNEYEGHPLKVKVRSQKVTIK